MFGKRPAGATCVGARGFASGYAPLIRAKILVQNDRHIFEPHHRDPKYEKSKSRKHNDHKMRINMLKL